ncbi:sulfotransferase family protein [Gaetbulibacter aestuarii]|uniref:Sulfotransferase n=1 Tax=Gaetbulibacter aestuarii TaxID=1502358 RepID=A0ABW7MUR0_9FLAO
MKGNIIFIVGVGRSGTSLLQSMLNSHSEIVSLPETQFFRKYIASGKKKNQLEKKGVESFIKILETDKAFQRLNVPLKGLKSLKNQDLSIKSVYWEILEIFIQKESKKHIVDKDPRNLDFINKIIDENKGAKVIQIVRDPRDVVLSKTKANWSAKRPYWLHALIGEAQILNSQKYLKEVSNDKFFQIKYEDLLSTPKNVLERLCQFLEVKYEVNMLNFNKFSKELISKEEMQWKKETLGPLLKNNSKKWRYELTHKQVVLIECMSEFSMKKFGYTPSFLKTPIICKLLFKSLKVLSHFFNKSYYLKVKLLTR